METRYFKEVDDSLVDILVELDGKIFPDPLSAQKIKNELLTKKNVSAFITYDGDTAVAFKVGFERSQRIYYSWIGGVIPEYRGRGLSKILMEQQHTLAKELGYKIVCTQTDNTFKPMIILNLKSGFEIKGTIQSTGDNYITIIMEKDLTN